MTSLLGQEVVEKIVEKGADKVFDSLGEAILGGVALLCLFIAGVSVYKLISVQERYTVRQDKQTEKVNALVEKMTETFSAVNVTLTELTNAERDSQRQAQEHMNLLQQMKQSQDTIIRDAVNAGRYRRTTPPPGVE